ncbi:MATE family efflux transporter [Desulfurivibrio dismutans]|uniref:MATE family efflux transporter n=1 Tax=Desulfurivibrio dismutans TaxID=1398908 RepID=UPI003D6458C6
MPGQQRHDYYVFATPPITSCAGPKILYADPANRHTSPADLAAVTIGGSIWLPVFFFAAGILMAITPIVAQHFGETNHRQIPGLLRPKSFFSDNDLHQEHKTGKFIPR